MSDGDNQADPSVAVAERSQGLAGGDQEPGWYPRGRNPNEQSYWDGERYTDIRHWLGSQGWVAGPMTPLVHPSGSVIHSVLGTESPPGRRVSTASSNLSIGGLGQVVAGIALMYGSVGTWVKGTASIGSLRISASVNGTDPSVTSLLHTNGWITFIAGTVLLVFGGLLLLAEDGLVAGLSFMVSFAAVGVAAYDVIRIAHKVSGHADASVGAGLIFVLAASVLALVLSGVTVIRAK